MFRERKEERQGKGKKEGGKEGRGERKEEESEEEEGGGGGGEERGGREALMVKLPSQGIAKTRGKVGREHGGPAGCLLISRENQGLPCWLGSRTQRLSTLIPRLLKAGKSCRTHPAPSI